MVCLLFYHIVTEAHWLVVNACYYNHPETYWQASWLYVPMLLLQSHKPSLLYVLSNRRYYWSSKGLAFVLCLHSVLSSHSTCSRQVHWITNWLLGWGNCSGRLKSLLSCSTLLQNSLHPKLSTVRYCPSRTSYSGLHGWWLFSHTI